MKKIALFFLFLFAMSTIGFADVIYLDNQSPYPNIKEKSQLAIQWASSKEEMREDDNPIKQRVKSNPHTVQVIHELGKIELAIPSKAKYFRALVWSNGQGDPDTHSNWVLIVPNRTYKLTTDHLIPVLLEM